MATNPILQFPPDTQELMNAILAQAGTAQTAAALLVGSYGESGWNPYDSGSGGGGAFGFTPPSYPSWLETAPPTEQVAAILPAYLASLPLIPASVTNPAARAEWQAIASERPLGFTGYNSGELETITLTNAPTTYGANSSYWVQNWEVIAEIVAWGFPPPPPPINVNIKETDDVYASPDSNKTVYRLSVYTPDAGQEPDSPVEKWRELPADVAQTVIASGVTIYGASMFALWGTK